MALGPGMRDREAVSPHASRHSCTRQGVAFVAACGSLRPQQCTLHCEKTSGGPQTGRSWRRARASSRAVDMAGSAALPSGAWLPGREYELVPEIGHGEGANSVVFHIRLRQPPRGEFALKMIKYFVGEEPLQRIGHAQSTVLARGLGAEWREPMSLPPHDCLVPVLHHYHADQPRLRDYVDPSVRDAVADRTLFLVMPLYAHGSLRTALEARRRSHPIAPFGLEWSWFGRQLLRMLRAVDHLISHHLVHGDIKDDQMFLDQQGQVGPAASAMTLSNCWCWCWCWCWCCC